MSTNTPIQTEPKETESKQSNSSESQEDRPACSEFTEHTHKVEDTPFTVIYHNGKHHICIANNIVGDRPFDSIEEAEAYIEQKPWQLILVSNYIYGKMVEQKIKEEKERQQQQQQQQEKKGE